MTRSTRPDPAQIFTDLIESTGRIEELAAERSAEVQRQHEAVRAAFALGVTVPALATATRLSEAWIKRIVAEGGTASERRQNRPLSVFVTTNYDDWIERAGRGELQDYLTRVINDSTWEPVRPAWYPFVRSPTTPGDSEDESQDDSKSESR